ncbi:MAG: tetratricopeptide repeat protein [Actinomycetota bacterium]|nr:tetratricopeptide repeat protein [Actinomycetota bacterium]
MNRISAQPQHRIGRLPNGGLGERLRTLRVNAGLTQTDLAGERFSKEYVSQIERGKTRPTQETIAWLADRLGVDAGFLASGVSADERGRIETALARAEALSENHEYQDALEEYTKIYPSIVGIAATELELRSLAGEAWARMRTGQVKEAIELLTRARTIAEDPIFSDVDRADILFRLGACRVELSSIQTALGLLNEALALAERSGLPCDRLRAEIYRWRSRCYRRHRDYEAAREDLERALELAEALDDPRTVARVYFHASLVAERQGQWVLARKYAEQAKSQFEDIADRATVGKVLNNLGGLSFLLGKPEEAVEQLNESFRVLLEYGSEADAARAVSSLAQVQLRTGQIEPAEEQARQALKLLGDRVDVVDEIGNAQLVLGRSLLEQGRLDEAGEAFDAAERSFEQLSSVSHRASAWIAKGDLAARRGRDQEAAHLYRRAAEALQDFRF